MSWFSDTKLEWPDYLKQNPAMTKKVLPENCRVEVDDYTIDGASILQTKPDDTGAYTFVRVQTEDMDAEKLRHIIGSKINTSVEDINLIGYGHGKGSYLRWLSIKNINPEKIRAFNHPEIDIMKVHAHDDELRNSDIKHNRFTVKLFNQSKEEAKKTQKALGLLVKHGAPNSYVRYCFGPQNRKHRLGWALIKRKYDWFVKELLTQKSEQYDNKTINDALEEENWSVARDVWPEDDYVGYEIINSLVRYSDKPKRAINQLSDLQIQSYIETFQGFAFNRVLENRIETYHQLEEGDVAYMHKTGGCFPVSDPREEEPRRERFEISATGPIYGQKLLQGDGKIQELEEEIREKCDITYNDLQQCPYDAGGRRRPLRVPVNQASVEWTGSTTEVNYTLPVIGFPNAVIDQLLQ